MKNGQGSRFWAAFGACIFLSLLLRAGLAPLPLERDEGGYAYIAQRWLLGEVPYKHSFDQKPPGIAMAYAAVLSIFGETPAAIHWGAALYGLGTLAFLILLGSGLGSSSAGLSAGLLGAFLLADRCVLGSAANTETFMILPLCGALFAVLSAMEKDSLRWSALTGALGAAACLFKQSAALNFFFCLGLLAAFPGRRRERSLALLAGGAGVVLPVLAYFTWHGALGELYDCVIGYNLRYGAKVPFAQYPARFWISFSGTLVSFWPVYMLAGIGLANIMGRKRWILCGWFLACAAGAALGGFFREHYFIQVLPPIALLAGLGAAAFKRLPAGMVALAVVGYGVGTSAWYYRPGPPAEKSRRLYGANPFPESVEVADFISANSGPQDEVFIFGSEPQILFYARRKTPSRYIYSYPLVTPFADTLERQREALADVERAAPRFIVTSFVTSSLLASSRAPLEIFDGLKGLLKDSYRIAAVTRLRRDGPPEMVIGDEARRLWNGNPMWYGTRIWGSLAVWERIR